MKNPIWSHIKLPKQMRFLLLVAVLILPMVITIGRPIAANAATPPASATDLNELWDLGTNCHDFQNSGSMWDNCNNDQSTLHDGLKCSSNMFYQKTDPVDPTHKLNDWFTNASNYTDCYNKAKAQVDILAGQSCQTLAYDTSSSSTNWSICQSAQNSLKYTLGCDPHMYQDTHHNNYWSIITSRLTNCQSRLQAAGDVQIKDPNGNLSAPASSGSATSNGSDSTGSIGNDTTSDKKLDCDIVATSPISWIVCPITDALTSMADLVDGWITDLLSTNTNEVFCTSGTTDISSCTNKNQTTSDAYYSAWAAFRNIALGLMVIAGLVILIAQALGMEIVDAYTLRKTLPRLLIAAIGITLSWPLMRFAVDLTNDLGFGIRHLIYAPFSQIKDTFNLGFGGGFFHGLADFFFSSVGFLVILGALFKAAIAGILFSLAGSAALAVFVAIVVLILRQVAIIFLIILAPIAIVAYVLPNTSKVYNLWWDSFMKALLMFPLIAGIIAAGRVFSAVTFYSGHDVIHDIIGFIAYFAPYFVIPFTVRFAGGFMRQIGGFVNDRSRGGFERLRNRRAKQWQQVGQDIRSGQFTRQLGAARPKSFRGRLDRGLQRASNIGAAGIRPSMWKGNIAQSLTTADNKGTSKELLSELTSSPVGGNDTLAEALSDNDFDLDRAHQDLVAQVGKPKADQMISAYVVTSRDLRKKGYSERAIQIGTVLSGLSATTAYTRDKDYDDEGKYIGSANLAATIARLTAGDSNLQAQTVAAAMEAVGPSQRAELAPSFTELFTGVQDIDKASASGSAAREAQISATGKTLRRTSIYKKGISALFGSGHTTRHLAKEYETMINEAREQRAQAQVGNPIKVERLNERTGKLETVTLSGEKAKTFADDKYMQMLAEVVALQNNSGNLPLEKRPAIASLIEPFLGEANAMRTDPKFQKLVSDFSYLQQQNILKSQGINLSDPAAVAAALAQLQAQQGAQQGPGAGPGAVST